MTDEVATHVQESGLRHRTMRIVYTALVIALYAFLLAPIVIVVVMSFNSALYLTFPPDGFSLRWYRRFFSDPIYIEATITSLIVSGVSVFIATILGTLSAYALQRYNPAFGRLINLWILSPMLLPGVILGLALLYTLTSVGLQRTIVAVIVGHTLFVLPFIVITVTSSLQHVQRELEEVARSLGASDWYAFRTIVLPLILPGIVSGALFAFIMSLDEYIIAAILGGGLVDTLPIRIFASLRFAVDPTIAAVSTVFIFATTLLFLLALAVGRRR